MVAVPGHTLIFLVAVAASPRDDSTVLVQRVQAPERVAEQSRVGHAPPRRIQYLFENQAGLSDRLQHWGPLNNLGYVHNATVHIRGGRYSPRRYLTTRHSAVFASDWAVYFDTAAHNGNPFHPIDENMAGCKTIAEVPPDWFGIFDHGGYCVNIMLNMIHGDVPDSLFKPRHGPTLSATVSRVAEQALRRSLVSPPFKFGYLHIRRCDRLKTNAECTNPEHVRALVAESPESTWLVFSYAEVGYLSALKRKLQPLARHNKTFVYEESLRFDVAGDNYLLYASMLSLRIWANSSVDLHVCHGKKIAWWKWLGTAVATEEEILEKRGTCRS